MEFTIRVPDSPIIRRCEVRSQSCTGDYCQGFGVPCKKHEDTLTSIAVACNADWRIQPGAGPYWAGMLTLDHCYDAYEKRKT